MQLSGTRTGPWTDHPDQIAWSHLSASREGEKPAPPVFVISPRAGLELSREMAGRAPLHIFSSPGEKPSTPPRFRVHLKIQSEVTKPGRQGLVEGLIRVYVHSSEPWLVGNNIAAFIGSPDGFSPVTGRSMVGAGFVLAVYVAGLVGVAGAQEAGGYRVPHVAGFFVVWAGDGVNCDHGERASISL